MTESSLNNDNVPSFDIVTIRNLLNNYINNSQDDHFEIIEGIAKILADNIHLSYDEAKRLTNSVYESVVEDLAISSFDINESKIDIDAAIERCFASDSDQFLDSLMKELENKLGLVPSKPTSSEPRRYYSIRTGKHPTGSVLTMPLIVLLFQNLYRDFENRGYFQEAFGYSCVDAGEVQGKVGDGMLISCLSFEKIICGLLRRNV